MMTTNPNSADGSVEEDPRKLSDHDFALWVEKVKEQARDEAYAKVIKILDVHADQSNRKVRNDPYLAGRADGLDFAATIANRVAQNVSPEGLLKQS